MSYLEAMGWLALIVVMLPVLGYLLLLLLARPRPHVALLMGYWTFVAAWFLAALPVLALLWPIPPLPRAAIAAAVIYLAALWTPLAAGMARYPLHIIRCRRLPLVATHFAANSYYQVPGSPDYAVTPFDDCFFCSPSEAEAEGFSESPLI